jgi:hypothetical protein
MGLGAASMGRGVKDTQFCIVFETCMYVLGFQVFQGFQVDHQYVCMQLDITTGITWGDITKSCHQT